MHVRDLQTLVKISQVASFSKAARELNTSLSTVSMQMRSLEESLGVGLFDRTYRPPKLTPLGLKIARQASQVVDAEQALHALCGQQAGLAGRFRVGFVATASVRLLPSFLKHAAEHAPNAEFEFETALSETLQRRVRRGQLDAAVVTESVNSAPDLCIRLLHEERLKYAVPVAHAGKSPAELFNTLPFLQFNPASGIGQLIEQIVESDAANAKENPIVLESVEAIVECVNQGIGFTLLAAPDIDRYAKAQTGTIIDTSKPIYRNLSLISGVSPQSLATHKTLLGLFE